MMRLWCGRMLGRERGRVERQTAWRWIKEGVEHGDVLILDGTVRFQHTRANPCHY